MALKAITIDESNQKMLATRFNVEDGDEDDVLPKGFILITEFGNDDTFDVLLKAKFDELFVATEEIENGFMAVEAK